MADRFRLERELGRGAMGAVWLAHHIALEVPCAVKFIHGQAMANPEARLRFEREAKAAAQLRSPFVVQILDYGIHEDVPYLAMEHLVGESLKERLLAVPRLTPEETFPIILQVGRALGKAHRVGIVHRDLKPGNVFLVQDEDGEIAKVLDFGVAKETRKPHGVGATQTGALLGTPSYMSPEQARGEKSVDARSDLWALAVVTYRCMTGELPYKEQSLVDLLLAIVSRPAPVPSHVAPGLPPGFDAWWAKASQRDPDGRFQSASELVDALAVALGMSQPSMLDASVPLPGLFEAGLPGSQSSEADADSLAVTRVREPRSSSRGQEVPPVGAGRAYGAVAAVPLPASAARQPEATLGSIGGVLKPSSTTGAGARRTALWLALGGVALAGAAAWVLVSGSVGSALLHAGTREQEASSASAAASRSGTPADLRTDDSASAVAPLEEASGAIDDSAASSGGGPASASDGAGSSIRASPGPSPAVPPPPSASHGTGASTAGPPPTQPHPPPPAKPKDRIGF